MLLTDTNDLIEIVLTVAVATNEFQFNSFYVDHTSSSLTPGASNGTTNGTTAVTAVNSPSASTQRQVKYLTIYNNDTISNILTVRFDDGTNERNIIKIILQPGETLEYVANKGWRIFDPYGIRKEGSNLSVPKPKLLVNPGFVLNTVGTRTLTSTQTVASYIGRAEYPYTSAILIYRMTTGMATITWAEVGIASGTFNMGGDQTLTTRGFTDVSAIANSTGIKNTTVSLSGVKTGMDLYCMIGVNATTPGIVRAGLGDDITSGVLSAATARPSTMSANTSFTLAANTDTQIWWSVYFI